MRLILLSSHAHSLINFRGALLNAMSSAGHEVHAAAPNMLAESGIDSQLRTMGVTTHDVQLSRTGLNPLVDLKTLLSLVFLLRGLKPDVILSYSIKPVIWGSIAARLAGVPGRFALITGLGYAFTGDAKGKRRVVQWIARALYRFALGGVDTVFFQNPDDAALFRQLRLVSAEARVIIVNGSGVDLAHYEVAKLPDGNLRFLLIARLLGDKGIREYAEAARKICEEYPGVGFDLVGAVDSNPDSVPMHELRGWLADGILTWHGTLADVRPAIAAAHVFVLPSYREGTPRTVLEAMSMGRAIITTDAPGCRETVVDGENGFLIPVRDVDALIDAMRRFISNPELAAQMGIRSRKIAEDKYDVHKVNAVVMREMAL